MQAAHALLHAALRAAPRRYRLPPLPRDVAAAQAAGVETALAFTIEAARLAVERGTPAADALGDLFVGSLAAFLRAAMAPQGGDAAFQALVLQAHEPEVREFADLSGRAAADRRTLRSMADAVAHPGKTRTLPPGPAREALARLHALVDAGDWAALRDALEGGALFASGADPAVAVALDAIRSSPALPRLARREALLDHANVRRFRALCEQRGPLAGSRAAAAQGRGAARAGEQAERATVEAFRELAALLAGRGAAQQPLRVVRSLRPPPGFPGAAGKAKNEWDAAIVCGQDDAGVAIELLAEVKASPAAASSDFSRLQRGLARLAQADPAAVYGFASPDGMVRIAGASLRALQPQGRALPSHVIYCCTAEAQADPQVLAAASKAVLAAEPASLAYAQRLARGERPPDQDLLPVWDALMHAPRLRATLHQYATAVVAREAMLHPADLVATLAQLP